ncbi:MAG: hypothetical protein QOJ39_1227 [Candidatus Eremiobacteraeota bacterium]|jgi:hypothetical protein|nr:hypothetical protein [Candidatus Eremiobacteraeota bacterium]MEA2719363.1 hypothetical protein [Candidatus Eremiobacteraeota bacterium]
MRIPVLAAAAVLAASPVAFAATPAPKPAAAKAPAAPQRLDVTKMQPKELAPKKALHVEYTVEINKLGQVARVRSVKPSHDEGFDTHTYGNALQAFIRTADGKVILGTYRLTYDYDPKTLRVHRDVALLKSGGVNPNAKGAAVDMTEIAGRNHDRTPPPSLTVTPGPIPSVTIRRMPDLPQVMKSPPPR